MRPLATSAIIGKEKEATEAYYSGVICGCVHINDTLSYGQSTLACVLIVCV